MTTPLELLTADPNRIPSIADQYWGVGLGSGLGFTGACFVNWAMRKPVFSGIQLHVALTVAGGALGRWKEDRRNVLLAERDAVLRRYIELHPEDFPAPERKKYADILEPWIPVR